MDNLFSFGMVCVLAVFLVALAIIYRLPHREESAAPQAEMKLKFFDMKDAVLFIVVRDLGDKSEIEFCGGGRDGRVGMDDVAFAAAYLTSVAARNCPDGFEKGLEHIQEDAIGFARMEEIR
jgi:hypothetical protein